jgi:OOP family OmpA-OmpF porin
MKKAYLAMLAATGALHALPAAAQLASQTGFYAGGTLGGSSFSSGCRLGGSCDDNDTAFKIFGGYQVDKHFAGELGVVDLGRARSSAGGATDEVKARAWDLTAVASIPVVERFSVFGRLGLYFARVEENTNFRGDSSHTNTDLTYGVGVRYDFTRNLAVRGELQRYNDAGGGDVLKTDIDLLGISVLWKF